MLHTNITDTISGADWSIQIYDAPDDKAIGATRLTGKYAGAGFQIAYLFPSGANRIQDNLECVERVSSSAVVFTGTAGSYCQWLFKGSLLHSQPTRVYSMP